MLLNVKGMLAGIGLGMVNVPPQEEAMVTLPDAGGQWVNTPETE